MMKTAAFVLLALLAAVPAQAQLQAPPVSTLRTEPPAPPANAQTAATPMTALSSSEKARDNPGVQYLLMKTVVAQAIGVLKTRALPVEAGGYNLLKYCWTPANVLGDWGESSGLTGEMVVRALETLSWSRDLARAGYPEAPVAEAIGRYEATLVARHLRRGHAHARPRRAARRARGPADAQRRAPRRSSPATRCNRQPSSFGVERRDGAAEAAARGSFPTCCTSSASRSRSTPATRCAATTGSRPRARSPMSFAGETVYSVSWPDDTVGHGAVQPRRAAHRRNGDAAAAAPEEVGAALFGAVTSAPAP